MPAYETRVGRVLYIHIPKTGGTSVETYLASAGEGTREIELFWPDVPCNPQHYHGEILAKVLRDAPPVYSFMTVRHPIERIVSEFKFQSRKPQRAYRRFFFSWWLRRNLRRAAADRYRRDNHFRPQSEFEAFGPEIFRLEDGLAPCFARVGDLLGIPLPAVEPQGKKSREVTVQPSADDLALIRDFYRVDFDRFGYR